MERHADERGRVRRREHLLVLYRSSQRADAALRALAERASRITVVVLARQEAPRSGCCDTRSALWNSVCRDLAQEDLSRALGAIGSRARAEFHLLVAPGREVVRALADEALGRGADEIVLADPRGSGLTRSERRRLRRDSAVPVSA